MTSEVVDQNLGSARIKRVALWWRHRVRDLCCQRRRNRLLATLDRPTCRRPHLWHLRLRIAWMTILAYFSALGFDIALLRFLPAYQTKGARSLARGVIRYAERRALAVWAFGDIGGGFDHLDLVPAVYFGAQEYVPRWILSCTGLGVVVDTLLDYSRVRRRGDGAGAGQVVRDGLLLVLVALTSLGLRWHTDAPLVMTATLVGSTVALGLASLSMRRFRPGVFANAPPEYDAATVAPHRDAACGHLSRRGSPQSNRCRAAGLVRRNEGGRNYSLVFSISFLAMLPRTAINTLFAPTIFEPVHAQ